MLTNTSLIAVHGTWAQNTSLPALRTIQPIINPVDNTTSTSVSCNPGVVPEEYETELCLTLRLGENCDLLCEAIYDNKGPFNMYGIALQLSLIPHLILTPVQHPL